MAASAPWSGCRTRPRTRWKFFAAGLPFPTAPINASRHEPEEPPQEPFDFRLRQGHLFSPRFLASRSRDGRGVGAGSSSKLGVHVREKQGSRLPRGVKTAAAHPQEGGVGMPTTPMGCPTPPADPNGTPGSRPHMFPRLRQIVRRSGVIALRPRNAVRDDRQTHSSAWAAFRGPREFPRTRRRLPRTTRWLQHRVRGWRETARRRRRKVPRCRQAVRRSVRTMDLAVRSRTA